MANPKLKTKEVRSGIFVDGKYITRTDLSVISATFPKKFDGTLVIPEGINVIARETFSDKEQIKKVILPSTIRWISNWAFAGCTALEEVVIDDAVQELAIDEGCFNGCTALKKLSLPSGVKILGQSSICLDEISIDAKNPYLKVEDGAVYSIGDNVLLSYWGDAEELAVAPGTKTIWRKALSGLRNMKKATLPDSVTQIFSYAFAGCDALSEVILPPSVLQIAEGCFMDCTKLESISLPDSLTELGEQVFSGCSSLTSVTIPKTITVLKTSLFKGCSALNSVIIPESVTEIQGSVFEECTGITSITIPDSVVEISSWGVFKGCTSLKEIHIKNASLLEGVDIGADVKIITD